MKESTEEMWKLFLDIWEERDHYSEISQKFLGDEPLTVFFHHILPKELYDEIKYEKWNILLVTINEHERIHNGIISERMKKIINKTKEKYEDWKEKTTKVGGNRE